MTRRTIVITRNLDATDRAHAQDQAEARLDEPLTRREVLCALETQYYTLRTQVSRGKL